MTIAEVPGPLSTSELLWMQRGFPSSPQPRLVDMPPLELSRQCSGIPALSINRLLDANWREREEIRRVMRKWRRLGCRLASAHELELLPFRGHRVRLTVALPQSDGDPRNFAPLTTKSIIDGIVKAGVLIPDDCATWLEEADPVLWRPATPHMVVRVELASRQIWTPGAA